MNKMNEIQYQSLKIYCRKWLHCFKKKEFSLYYEPFCNQTPANEEKKCRLSLQLTKKFLIDPLKVVGCRPRHVLPLFRASQVILDFSINQKETTREFVQFNMEQIMIIYTLMVQSPIKEISFDNIYGQWEQSFYDKFGPQPMGSICQFSDLVDEILEFQHKELLSGN